MQKNKFHEQNHAHIHNDLLTPINDRDAVNFNMGMILKGTHTDATIFPHSVMSSSWLGFAVLARAANRAGTRAAKRQKRTRQYRGSLICTIA
jgi:hypothetical protein